MQLFQAVRSAAVAGVTGLVLWCASPTCAAPANEQQAVAAVRAWLASDPTPFQEKLGRQVQQVAPIKDQAGDTLYYVVDLAPSGFVIVAADDWVEPIIAFARHGRFDPSRNDSLGALLTQDLSGRMAAARSRRGAAPEGPRQKARNKWRLLEQVQPAGAAIALAIGTVSDLRVAPFVQSRWSQETADGEACYNYFTPPHGSGAADNYPCGCVPTAMAQLMRYYQHPTGGVGTPSFLIQVDGVLEYRSLRGGDGYGGPYAWADMPMVPIGASDTQRRAIGALTMDAGVAVGTDYAWDGAAAEALAGTDALTQIFGYSNGRKGYNSGSTIGAGLNGMINPNVDARFPVILGVSGNGGHAVVVDGYGFNLSTLYHHLNLGWGGADDAWYALPTIDTSLGTFTVLSKCIYNVYVSGAGEIISGRVVQTNGTPLASATVTATRVGGGTATATTDANGIYALAKIPSGSEYSVSVSKAGYATTTRTVSTGTSTDFNATCGNVWGVDFTLSLSTSGPPTLLEQPASLTVLSGETAAFSVSAAGGRPLYYQWQANEANLPGQTNATLVLSGVSPSQAGPYRVLVHNASGNATSWVATLTIQTEMTQHFTAPGAITIPGIGPASSYPSAITVEGLSGVVVKATVTLSNLTHTWPGDLDLLLVGPRGQAIMLMSDAGYGYGLTGVTLTFDDASAGFLPDNALIAPGASRPTAYEAGDVLGSPAPAGPHGTKLSSLNGTDPNGTWRLFIQDDSSGDAGTLTAGWSLRLTVSAPSQAVDHFVWTPIGSPQLRNTAFPVMLTAQDAANRTLTHYAGTVSLSAAAEGPAQSIRGSASHQATAVPGTYTDGYAFTPNTNLVVTHVRHYYGEKVSIWTDGGVLLASEMVRSVPGTWVETPLQKPILLAAGTRYRIGTFYNSNTVAYYCSSLPHTFSHGTVDQSYYSWRDRFPADPDTVQYLVDIRYALAIPIAPASSGPMNQGVWAGSLTVQRVTGTVVLRAEDGNEHVGLSNPFGVNADVRFEVAPGSLQCSNGVFAMQLLGLGTPGSLVVEASTNLLDWQAIFTNAAPTNRLWFTDPAAGNNRRRFYRALDP